MRNTNKLVQGVGTKGMVYPSCENNKKLREYTAWCGMLERCTGKYWVKNPSYTGTTCSEYFKYYPNFYEWCNSQTGFRGKDEKGKSWHLDKDLLIKGNKLYSEDTCVFLPQSINSLLTKSEAARGEFPLGMYFNKQYKKYKVRCLDGRGNSKYLGLFLNKMDAFVVYKDYKESVIKQIAEKYKYQLDPRAYEALLNYTVEITD